MNLAPSDLFLITLKVSCFDRLHDNYQQVTHLTYPMIPLSQSEFTNKGLLARRPIRLTLHHLHILGVRVTCLCQWMTRVCSLKKQCCILKVDYPKMTQVSLLKKIKKHTHSKENIDGKAKPNLPGVVLETNRRV